jgi:hypothetical protein
MLHGRALDAQVARSVFGQEVTRDYSTTWEGMGLVIDRLRSMGLGVVIGSEGDGWEVEIIVTEALHAQGYRGCYTLDALLPAAVSRAAVRSLEHAGRPAGEGEG